jgi:hypothetical protein
MTLAYFDCFHGAAGDMLLAALLDAGLDRAALDAVLSALPLSGYTLEHWEAHSHHLRGSRVAVRLDAPQPARSWADLRQMLRDSPLPERTRHTAYATFERLARAEAGVHGVPLDAVHFHEVGAVDSIVDTVGVCAGLELLGIERVYASALPLGQGWVRTQHGPLPVPAPATLALLAEAGAPLVPPPDPATPGELLTPTAAALLCELATFGQPAMRLQRVGTGLGSREFARPNGLRVWLGEQEPATAPAVATDATSEQVRELRCNLDDATGELVAYALERLREAGALDAWAVPLVMKKGRPATQLGCLARPADAAALAALLLRETPTLGVRWETMQRLVAAREVVSVATPWGPVRLKRKLLDGAIAGSAPEYEDCAALARAHQVPLAQVYAAALQAAAQEADAD